MFSTRFDWDQSPNALSLLLRDKKRKGETVLDLTESNPTRVGLAYDVDDILVALSQPAAMAYAPDPRGLLIARQAIAQYYRDRGAPIDTDALFLTAGTSDAYSILFKLLGNPGDEVLIPRPGYPLLSYLARLDSLRACAYPLRYDMAEGWSIDLDVLQALITPQTRAIVLIDPTNPTGSYVKQSEWSALDAMCHRHDLALIVDEVFYDYGAGGATGSMPADLNRFESLTFVLNGFSKLMGLPQVKLGWIVVGETLACRRPLGRAWKPCLIFISRWPPRFSMRPKGCWIGGTPFSGRSCPASTPTAGFWKSGSHEPVTVVFCGARAAGMRLSISLIWFRMKTGSCTCSSMTTPWFIRDFFTISTARDLWSSACCRARTLSAVGFQG